MSTEDTAREPTALPQGDLRLLETEQARRLLTAPLPARYAYTARDGTPRVLPSWFHWTGQELVMPTFLSAPHVRRPARRLAALRTNPDVAVTIDTETFPPQVLLLRGRAHRSPRPTASCPSMPWRPTATWGRRPRPPT
jgi:hypothetical protein